MSMTFKLDGIDLSPYVRVGPQDSMDPYGSGWQNPAFSEAAFGEGHPLLNVDAGNREMVWPLYLKGAAKDTLHALVAQINTAIANPASSPLRIEWKDSGATNSTFYDVTFARLDPHFNFRLSEHSYADLALHVWCAPPYGHTASERIIATAAGTAPGLTASLIGVASPLTGDVAPQVRVTVNTSGEAVGPAGRGVIVSAPKVAGYQPFISAASFAGPHPSSALIGASGAPGSQALFTQGPADSGPIARLGLSATMYAGRKRIYAALLSRTYTRQGIWAADTYRQPVGPTAVAYRPDGFQVLDLGVVSIPTYSPTTEIGLYAGPVIQTASDGMLGKPPYSGANASSGVGIAGIYVMPEDTTQAIVDQSIRPMARSFFGASGGGTALIEQLVGDYGETWASTPGGAPSAFYGVNKMHFIPNSQLVWGSANPARDFRARGIFHLMNAAATGDRGMFGVTPKGNAQQDFVLAQIRCNSASPALMNVVIKTSAAPSYAATLIIASVAGFPVASTLSPLVVDITRVDSKLTVNAQWANATAITYIPSAGMSATTVPIASAGVADPLVRTVGVPFISSGNTTDAFSYLQFDEVRNAPQPSDAYRLTAVSADTPLRSPITGSGPNVPLQGAVRGPVPVVGASHTGITALDWQLDGGPMNDPMGVEVRVRERFSYAR